MSAASYLILIQVVSRGLTFAGNQILLRYIYPEAFGIATQLELYSVSVLYLSRESLRVALQRRPLRGQVSEKRGKDETSSQIQAQASVNVSYIPVALGFLLSSALGVSFWKYGSQEVVESPGFTFCLQLYGLATFIELLGEPGFTVVQQSLDFRSRAVIETAGSIVKCFTACFVALLSQWNPQRIAILPFAAGQLTYACTLCLGYTFLGRGKAKVTKSSLTMRPIYSHGEIYLYRRFSQELLSLSTSLYIQSAVKQVLTQGDALILAAFSSLEEQGAFALASNYGGLAARLIFQPVEESSRSNFGRLLSRDSSGNHQKGAFEPAISSLSEILRAYSIMSIFACCFAPSLFPMMVRILAGDRWFSPAMQRLLATYCFYVPFMAMNGITEAFVSSVASSQELKMQALWMGSFSAGFGLAAFFFLRLLNMGAPGLVWANVTNMFLRSIWSLCFIQRYLQRNGSMLHFAAILPTPWSVLSGLVVSTYLNVYVPKTERLQDVVALAIICVLGAVLM